MRFTVSSTSIRRAGSRGIQVQIPWPVDDLGPYDPAKDSVGAPIDAWVADHFSAPEGFVSGHAASGRTASGEPVVYVYVREKPYWHLPDDDPYPSLAVALGEGPLYNHRHMQVLRDLGKLVDDPMGTDEGIYERDGLVRAVVVSKTRHPTVRHTGTGKNADEAVRAVKAAMALRVVDDD